MKHFRQLCALFCLLLVFALPINAGQMDTPPEALPGDAHTPGRMASDVKISSSDVVELAIEVVKSLLAN